MSNQVKKSIIVRLEPNEKYKLPIKLKMSQAKVDSTGMAVQDREGNVVKTDVDLNEHVKGTVQVPGTSKNLKPALTPNGINTGLDYMIDNPYKEEDSYNPEWGDRVLKGKDKVMLQHALEYKHGRDHNYYTNKLFNRIEPTINQQDLPWFLTPAAHIPLTGNVVFLNMDNPIHELQYHMARVHPDIAPTYESLDDMTHCQYYLVEDDSDIIAKTSGKRKFNKAAVIVEEMYSEKDKLIIDFAKALENDSRNLERETAYTWLDDFYKVDDPNYSKFMKIYSLYRDPTNRDQFFAASRLQSYVDLGIVRKGDDQKYYWIMPETEISPMKTFEWTSKEKAIKDFLLAPEYKEEVELLHSIYESRKNS